MRVYDPSNDKRCLCTLLSRDFGFPDTSTPSLEYSLWVKRTGLRKDKPDCFFLTRWKGIASVAARYTYLGELSCTAISR